MSGSVMGTMGRREDDIVIRWCVKQIFLDVPCSSAMPGPDCPESISCLIMDGDAVWASVGSDAVQYLRGKEVRRILVNEVIHADRTYSTR